MYKKHLFITSMKIRMIPEQIECESKNNFQLTKNNISETIKN